MAEPSQSALQFVTRTVSRCCPNFPLSDDVIMEYAKALSRYQLTSDQWERVLDILSKQEHRGMPPLSAIYAVVSEVEYSDRPDDSANRGLMIYKLADGIDRALFVKRQQAKSGPYWAIASVQSKKSNGEVIECQRFAGIEALERLKMIPGAELVGIFPDKPAWPMPEEMPTAEEMAEIREQSRKLDERYRRRKQGAGIRPNFATRKAEYDDSAPEHVPHRVFKEIASPGFSGEKNEVLKKSTRKENPAPAPQDETDDGGYWESLLSS